MRTYKEEYSVPTSANAKLAIRHGNKKLKTEKSPLIMESELQNKYEEKKKIRKQMMMMILYNSVIHRVDLAHKSKLKVINK